MEIQKKVINGKEIILIPHPDTCLLTPESPYYKPCNTQEDMDKARERCFSLNTVDDSDIVVGLYDFGHFVVVVCVNKDREFYRFAAWTAKKFQWREYSDVGASISYKHQRIWHDTQKWIIKLWEEAQELEDAQIDVEFNIVNAEHNGTDSTHWETEYKRLREREVEIRTEYELLTGEPIEFPMDCYQKPTEPAPAEPILEIEVEHLKQLSKTIHECLGEMIAPLKRIPLNPTTELLIKSFELSEQWMQFVRMALLPKLEQEYGNTQSQQNNSNHAET